METKTIENRLYSLTNRINKLESSLESLADWLDYRITKLKRDKNKTRSVPRKRNLGAKEKSLKEVRQWMKDMKDKDFSKDMNILVDSIPKEFPLA